MEGFLKTLNIWLTRPHVCNGRIFASKILNGSIFLDNCVSRRLIFKDSNLLPIDEFAKIENNVVNISSSLGSYDIIYSDGSISFQVSSDFSEHEVLNTSFLQGVLLTKFNLWLNQNMESNPPSLSLIDVELYQRTYERLKTQYGLDLVKNWEEKTDPNKFVFEDIAIVSYLMCLWSHKAKDDIRFVDVGCGNGLLVYLLTMEGYQGFGIDLRPRRIWDKYPPNVNLVIGAVGPETRYPGYNWWIGNHSDELTPWIPILAKRSSLLDANVFLLPCCPFDFFGKFTNFSSNIGVGRHQNYQQFIEHIVLICGLKLSTDTMRIPSTKRFCIIGCQQTDKEMCQKQVLEEMNILIKSRSASSNFQPRKAEIENRNCSTVNHKVRDHIITTVLSKLLCHSSVISTPSKREWNKGGKVSVSELSDLLPSEIKIQLKRENGGLQTLLKNQHQIFKVVGGFVEIRYEEDCNEGGANKRYRSKGSTKVKSRNCWFETCHPDGCPRTAANCSYIHAIDL